MAERERAEQVKRNQPVKSLEWLKHASEVAKRTEAMKRKEKLERATKSKETSVEPVEETTDICQEEKVEKSNEEAILDDVSSSSSEDEEESQSSEKDDNFDTIEKETIDEEKENQAENKSDSDDEIMPNRKARSVPALQIDEDLPPKETQEPEWSTEFAPTMAAPSANPKKRVGALHSMFERMKSKHLKVTQFDTFLSPSFSVVAR